MMLPASYQILKLGWPTFFMAAMISSDAPLLPPCGFITTCTPFSAP